MKLITRTYYYMRGRNTLLLYSQNILYYTIFLVLFFCVTCLWDVRRSDSAFGDILLISFLVLVL